MRGGADSRQDGWGPDLIWKVATLAGLKCLIRTLYETFRFRLLRLLSNLDPLLDISTAVLLSFV